MQFVLVQKVGDYIEMTMRCRDVVVSRIIRRSGHDFRMRSFCFTVTFKHHPVSHSQQMAVIHISMFFPVHRVKKHPALHDITFYLNVVFPAFCAIVAEFAIFVGFLELYAVNGDGCSIMSPHARDNQAFFAFSPPPQTSSAFISGCT